MPLKPIAYVQASWHTDITEHCKTAFMAELATHGYGAADVEFFSAPGSLEMTEVPVLSAVAALTS
jgi:6,7-dimethyl-8-ribityllumazine synthase